MVDSRHPLFRGGGPSCRTLDGKSLPGLTFFTDSTLQVGGATIDGCFTHMKITAQGWKGTSRYWKLRLFY